MENRDSRFLRARALIISSRNKAESLADKERNEGEIEMIKSRRFPAMIGPT